VLAQIFLDWYQWYRIYVVKLTACSFWYKLIIAIPTPDLSSVWQAFLTGPPRKLITLYTRFPVIPIYLKFFSSRIPIWPKISHLIIGSLRCERTSVLGERYFSLRSFSPGKLFWSVFSLFFWRLLISTANDLWLHIFGEGGAVCVTVWPLPQRATPLRGVRGGGRIVLMIRHTWLMKVKSNFLISCLIPTILNLRPAPL